MPAREVIQRVGGLKIRSVKPGFRDRIGPDEAAKAMPDIYVQSTCA